MTKCVCSYCGASFTRYPISAKRAARPQYCSQECFGSVMRIRANNNLYRRFYSRVDVCNKNNCWEWKGRRDPNGYGRIDIGGRPVLAHRMAFMFANGFECENVCHSCDNPPCCNPNHLWAGNPKLNVADMVKKGRNKICPPMIGETNPASRLSKKQAMEILNSTESNKELSIRFRVSATAVRYIKTGKNWRHLQEL